MIQSSLKLAHQHTNQDLGNFNVYYYRGFTIVSVLEFTEGNSVTFVTYGYVPDIDFAKIAKIKTFGLSVEDGMKKSRDYIDSLYKFELAYLSYLDLVSQNSYEEKIASKIFSELMSRNFDETRVFLLEPFTVTQNEVDELDNIKNAPLPLPFRCCAIENIDQSPLFSSTLKDLKDFAGLKIDQHLSKFKSKDGSDLFASVVFMRASEIDDYQYCIEMLVRIGTPYSVDVLETPFIVTQDCRNSDATVLHAVVNRLNSKEYQWGEENYNQNHKIKMNGEKKQFRIKKLIHVVNKKHIGKTEGKRSSNIDFSHRFEVRGHWRMFYTDDNQVNYNKLGKNRSGEYVVKGRTWVTDSVKGPKDKPLIKKTRVYDTSTGVENVSMRTSSKES